MGGNNDDAPADLSAIKADKFQSASSEFGGEPGGYSGGGGGGFLSKLASLVCCGGRTPASSSEKAEKQTDWRVVLTTVAIFVMFVIERGDDAVLPSLYAPVGAALVATPAVLSTVNLARALTQAAVAPLSGVLGDRCDRVSVIVAGALIWGVATLAMGAMRTVGQAVGLAVFNGVGLSLIVPSVQSLIADMYAPSQRGRAFGALYMISSLGSMMFGFFATSIGGTKVGALAGWRFAFLIVGAISLGAAALCGCIARDDRTKARKDAVAARRERRVAAGLPESDGTNEEGNGVVAIARAFGARAKDMASDVGKVLRVPTFIIIVVQGIVGSMPWTALSFLTLYLQMRGFEAVPAATVSRVFFLVFFHFQRRARLAPSRFSSSSSSSSSSSQPFFLLPSTSIDQVVALWGLGTAVGSALGGIVGDAASKRWPVAGRIATCQLSVAVSLPAAFVMTWWLPVGRALSDVSAARAASPAGAPLSATLASEQGHAVGVAAAVFFVLGSLVSWCGTNNSAMFAEVVPERLRSSVFAFDRSFETAIGALAGPIVGALSPKFGFRGTIKPGGAGVDQAALDANAKALGNAMLVMMVVPWALCGLAYFGLYFTLARDRATALRMEAELEAEDDRVKKLADERHEAEVEARSASLASSLSLSASMTGGAGGGGRRSEESGEDVPLKV